jgi:hypothetical protein
LTPQRGARFPDFLEQPQIFVYRSSSFSRNL